MAEVQRLLLVSLSAFRAFEIFRKSINCDSTFYSVESSPSPSKIRSLFGRSLWLAYTLQHGHITRTPVTLCNKPRGVVEVGAPRF